MIGVFDMLKKLNKYTTFSIIISALLMVLGIVIFIYPVMTLKVFSYAVSILLILFGIYLIVEDFRYRKVWLLFDFSLLGIVLLLLGIILLMYPSTLTVLMPIVLGIWFITSGIMKLKITSLLVNCDGLALSFVMSILSILCGILFVVSPLSGALAMVSFMGILLFVYSLSDIIDMIIFKKNVNKICKNLKDGVVITIE